MGEGAEGGRLLRAVPRQAMTYFRLRSARLGASLPPFRQENGGENMDRIVLAALPLGLALGLAGCGDDPAPAPEAVEAPVVMKAGEWTLTRKTTGYNTPTVTPAEYQAALKQTRDDRLCIAVDAAGVPDPDALAGAEGAECAYKDKLIRKGRLIATLSCKAGAGTSEIVLEGNFTADTLTLGSTMTKTVGGRPVLRTTHDVSGKRAGECSKG